jgi:hypothetical protein
MKKIIGLAFYGVTLFGIAAGVGWYLKNQALVAAAEAATAADEQAEEDARTLQATDAAEIHPVNAFGDPAIEAPDRTDQQMPVAVRPAPVTVEEIVRYGLGMKERDKAIVEREELLQRLERQQQLVLADIQGEQQEIEGLLIQARDQRIATETLLKQVIVRKKELESAAKLVPEPVVPGDAATAEPANLKGGSQLLEGMAPESAATVIREYANNGQLDLVVQLISRLEDRSAAAIIDALDDDTLKGEILQGVTVLKPKPKPTARR